jgi:hypothetical protein
MNENPIRANLPTEPGSVIFLDAFAMRTGWGNWVSEGCFTLTDEEIAEDIAQGYVPVVIFDAGVDE